MTTTARYATQNMIHIRDQCPHCHAVVSYCTESLPLKEQCHQYLKPIKFRLCICMGLQDW